MTTARSRAQTRWVAPEGAPELTIVAPTFNERENVPLLVERIAAALPEIAWEVIFVDDDSPDGTALVARDIGRFDARVRCIRRVGRRGLSGACVEGVLASQARFVAVIDADLQHDERVLRDMLGLLRRGACDVVIGSRYIETGSAVGLSRSRHATSQLGGALARLLLGIEVSDAMSGFFMLRRETVEEAAPELATEGFKILADILAARRGTLRVIELPYEFRPRAHGASKLDSKVALDFIGLLVARLTRNIVPVRFVSFLLVGASGLAVHLLVLKMAMTAFNGGFTAAQSLATLTAMTSNFYLNNFLTYRDKRLTGWPALRGLFLFYSICSVGALSNVGVASWLYANEPNWWLAGICGSIVGAVWNYAVSSALVWKR